MKIITSSDIQFVDEYTITHEPVTPEALVGRVGEVLYCALRQRLPQHRRVAIACGKGKNGGDGLALALALAADAAYRLRVLLCYPPEKLCAEAAYFYEKIKQASSVTCEQVSADNLPAFEPDELVVDALLGTGLSRPLAGYERQLVRHINGSGCCVMAVDIPSGMSADSCLPIAVAEAAAAAAEAAVVQARYTFTLNAPKLSMMLPASGECVGELHVLDIGLHPDAIDKVASPYRYFTQADARQLVKPRKKFSHKGSYGRCLLVAGAQGMMGAAVLAARACYHAGAGLLTAHVPGRGVDIMQIAAPEAVLSIDEDERCFTSCKNINAGSYNALAAGCGIGRNRRTAAALEALLQAASSVPMMLDADALNIIADDKRLLDLLPPNTILTPHVKEFERLAGKCESDEDRLARLQRLSQTRRLVVVLKGAHTAVALPNGVVSFNSSGNAGMATAGSGDVLTGVILALLGQGYSPEQAALLGVYMHGAAGDAAAASTSQSYVTATDIVARLYDW
ncbi:MAG: NAD(P)H-hydrate dehydratase [Prevotellaceae bacterium]|jgi:NAD(P)H-hydrate epimerase|nr:NAD(P)H-hydrate dehydratase [Prevotellaceae bacterium]